MGGHPEMSFMRPCRRGLEKAFDEQILASSHGSTDHLHCVEVPILAGESWTSFSLKSNRDSKHLRREG